MVDCIPSNCEPKLSLFLKLLLSGVLLQKRKKELTYHGNGIQTCATLAFKHPSVRLPFQTCLPAKSQGTCSVVATRTTPGQGRVGL